MRKSIIKYVIIWAALAGLLWRVRLTVPEGGMPRPDSVPTAEVEARRTRFGAGPAPAMPDRAAVQPAAMPGSGSLLARIPAGAFRTALLALDAGIREQVLEELAGLEVPENDFESLRVHPSGRLFYICDFGGGLPRGHADRHAAEHAEPAGLWNDGISFTGAVSVAAPPLWHSRPGSTNVLFLDFNGHVVTNTAWNSYPTFATPVWDCRPYALDGDDTTFSIAEQEAMRIIWERVAEDYAPFDINVTTEQPPAWNRRIGHVLVTPELDRNGNECPHFNAGGIAFVDVFGEADYSYDFAGESFSPAWVLNYEAAGTAEYEAEAASHELGHNLALSHDGTKSSAYYGGHENGSISWGPIMGASYNRDVTQWSEGDYRLSNNTENDLAIIEIRLGYVADDYGDDQPAAALLDVGATGEVHQAGLIERSTDTDVFQFTAASGAVAIAATPYRDSVSPTWGGNLDIVLELHDAGGGLLASDNPELDTAASLSTNLSAGIYYLHVKAVGVGDPNAAPVPTGYVPYGSLGQYALSGSIPLPPDLDGDGLPNIWEAAFFGDPTNASALTDIDGDGLDNLSEYISGHDPTNSSSLFRVVPASVVTTNGLRFVVSWDAAEGRLYNVLLNTNLANASFETAASDLAYPVNAYTDTLHEADTAGFYRIDVRLQD
jgi:hypothetical protein